MDNSYKFVYSHTRGTLIVCQYIFIVSDFHPFALIIQKEKDTHQGALQLLGLGVQFPWAMLEQGGSGMTRWSEDMCEDARGGKVPLFSPPTAAERAAFSQRVVLVPQSVQSNIVADPSGGDEILNDDGPGFWEADINRGFTLGK